MCYYCDSPVVNAENALFVCAEWGAAREALGQAMGADLTPDTMVPVILQSERFWTLIESFVTLVMRTRELDGRRERNNREGQLKSHRERTRGPTSQVDLAVRIVRGRNLFLPPLAGVGIRFA